MTKNQEELLKVLEDNFKGRAFYFSDLKEYGQFYPATLTSLVKAGLVKAQDAQGKKIYFLGSELGEETSLKIELKNLEGILTHLDKSYENWKRQLEEVGVEFPEQEFLEWSKAIKGGVNRRISQLDEKIYLLSSLNSAF